MATWTIRKYPVPSQDQFIIEMPMFAKILTVQSQNDKPMFWAIVDPESALEKRSFLLVVTGDPLSINPHYLAYIGTFQMFGGDLVFHLFEVNPPHAH